METILGLVRFECEWPGGYVSGLIDVPAVPRCNVLSVTQLNQGRRTTLEELACNEPGRAGVRPVEIGIAPLVRRSGTAIAGGLLSQALKAVVLIYLARVYGATEFGSFSFANSVNAFLFLLAQFGLPVFGSREVAQSGGRLSPGLLRAITEARLLLAIAGTVGAIVILTFLPGVTRAEYWLVIGFGLSNVALSGFSDWVFQGKGQLHGWAALNITWQFLWLALTVGLVHAHASIEWVSFGYAAGALVAVVAGLFCMRQFARRPSDHSSIPHYSARSVLHAGANLGVGSLLIALLVWTDTIIVRFASGPYQAGVYAAGNRIALALSMLASFYVMGAFPSLSQSATNSARDFSRCFQRAYEDLSLLFIPGSVWAVYFAPRIMLVLFKRQDYLAGVTVFRIFQGVLLVTIISNLYGVGALVAHRRDHAYRKALMISAAALLILCPALTLRWGLVGTAAAALLSQGLSLVLFSLETQDIICAEHLKTLGVPVLVGMVPVLAGILLHVGFWTSVAVLILMYIVLFVWRSRIPEPRFA